MKHRKFVGVAIGLLAILVSLFPGRWVFATGGDEGFEKEVNGYQVRLHFSGHAKTGSNPVEIQITAPGGEPVSAAVVEVSAEPGAAHADEEADAHAEEADEDSHMEGEPQATEAMDGHSSEPEPETTGGMEMHGAEETEQTPGETHDAQPADAHAAETGSHSEGEVDAAEDEVEPCNLEQPCTEDEHAEEGEDGPGESKEVVLKPAKVKGAYAGKVFFSEAGNWAVKVRFTTQEGAVEEHVDFTVDVVDAGPNWPVLGGFFGINAAIVAVAAVNKRKSTLVIPQ
jgi:hypothetical protein